MELLVLKSWDETLKIRDARAHKTISSARYPDELNWTIHNSSGATSSLLTAFLVWDLDCVDTALLPDKRHHDPDHSR